MTGFMEGPAMESIPVGLRFRIDQAKAQVSNLVSNVIV